MDNNWSWNYSGMQFWSVFWITVTVLLYLEQTHPIFRKNRMRYQNAWILILQVKPDDLCVFLSILLHCKPIMEILLILALIGTLPHSFPPAASIISLLHNGRDLLPPQSLLARLCTLLSSLHHWQGSSLIPMNKLLTTNFVSGDFPPWGSRKGLVMTYFTFSFSSIPAEWAFKEASLNRSCPSVTWKWYQLSGLVGVLNDAGNRKLPVTAKSHSRFSLLCVVMEGKACSLFCFVQLTEIHSEVTAVLCTSH